MESKKLMVVLTLTVIILVMVSLGASFAWYSFSNSGTNFQTSTANDDVTVTYTQDEYINTVTGVPITDDEIETKASKNQFSVLAGTNLTGYQVAIQIMLTDITIDDALKVDDFKYQLLENNQVIASGTGTTIGDNTTLIIKEQGNITVGTTYNYELRVWLAETGVSQNELMGKSFSAQVKIASTMKK